MIKILNIIQLIEGLKAFLEVVGMICKGMQHFKSKNNKPNRSSAMASETNEPQKE